MTAQPLTATLPLPATLSVTCPHCADEDLPGAFTTFPGPWHREREAGAVLTPCPECRGHVRLTVHLAMFDGQLYGWLVETDCIAYFADVDDARDLAWQHCDDAARFRPEVRAVLGAQP